MKLAGRVWGGHNIRRFDCARIREAFADCGRAPPTPAGIVDSFDLLNQKFGRRAGNLKVTMTSSLSLYLSLSPLPPVVTVFVVFTVISVIIIVSFFI